MESDDRDYVSDIVFKLSISEQFGAELAIGPALALVLGQIPSSGYRQTLVSVAMIVLVFSSLFRFLAFTGRFADSERVSQLTVRPLQLSAIIGLVQIIQFASIELLPFVPRVGTVSLSLLITLLGTILFIIGYESVFHTYRFSWGVLYYVKVISMTESVDMDWGNVDEITEFINSEDSAWISMKTAVSLLLIQVVRAVYVSVAYYLLRDSIPEVDDPYIAELQKWVKAHSEQKPISDRASIGFALGISGMVVIPVYFVLSWTLSWILGSMVTILGVVFIMKLLQHVVNVTYISFGGLRYDQILTTNARSIAIDGTYTLVVWVMLIWLPFG